jgi:hypothetical protein
MTWLYFVFVQSLFVFVVGQTLPLATLHLANRSVTHLVGGCIRCIQLTHP